MDRTLTPGELPLDSGDLDPKDWAGARDQAHRMLDDILDYVENVRERPVWRPIPDEIRARMGEPVPTAPTDLADVHGTFLETVLPYATGNVHPGFMGWVHGGGTVPGLLGEMLAAGLNANLGGRDHMPIEVERQIQRWMTSIFGFPEGATGIFVTGSSMANFMGVLVARTHALGAGVRKAGLGGGHGLVAYASVSTHSCVRRAMEMSGLGSDALRVLPVDANWRMDLGALRAALAADRAAGLRPFLVVGTAGTVDTGAIDPLEDLAEIARNEDLWFHVDGAYGALGMLSPVLAPRLKGIQQADSIAMDFHKWGQVPYDAGYLLVRDGARHREAFASSAAYLRREERGLAAGHDWPCDYGPDLSRGFRALKTWFTLKVHGTDRLGAAMERTCRLAKYLQERVEATPQLELLAPANLNIVCFRHRGEQADTLNTRLVADLHESGLAAPSTTTIHGHLAIRAAIVNHRTRAEDIDRLVAAVVDLGAKAMRTENKNQPKA
jgi:glutamate/tyrosine decarboxylase-like PLP-dependent enzyme